MSAADRQPTEPEIKPALSVAAARQLSQRFRDGLRRVIDKALGDQAEATSDKRKSLLFNYAMRCAHARRKVNVALIKHANTLDDKDLADLTRVQTVAFTLKEAKDLVGLTKGEHRQRHNKMFKPGQYRKYYRMPAPRPEDLGRTADGIIGWLRRQGFTEIDYIAGTCVDERKQTRRIGRCLPDERTKQVFANDPARQGGNLMMVISRHPYDLIRMSTGRGWESCMTKRGMYWEYVPKEVKQGSMVAYLVKQSDPEILDPMSRITIKPYRNEQGETLMMAGPTYGMGSAGFKQAVQAVMDREYNAGLYGTFRMPREVYNDGLPGQQRRIDPAMKGWDAAQWITFLGLEVEQRGGRKVIKGDLNLAHYELEQLPDFSGYEVEGNMRLDGNRLKTLGKLPVRVSGNFSATGNRLLIISSTLQDVGGDFSVDNNQIGSLIEGPERVGGSYSARNNRIGSMDGVPTKVPGDLILSQNQIASLEDGPDFVGGTLDMQINQLSNLAGVPQIGSKLKPGHARLSANRLVSLEGLEGRLFGGLDVARNEGLQSLQGCPQHLLGSFTASHCALASLQGGPKRVEGGYSVPGNKLTSLRGVAEVVAESVDASANPQMDNIDAVPKQVGGMLRVRSCGLVSLRGMPETLAYGLDLTDNQLRSLEGMPRNIGGDLSIARNKLTNLDGMARVVAGVINASSNELETTRGMAAKVKGAIYLNHNKLERLEDLPREVKGDLYLDNNRLTSTNGLPQIVRGNLMMSDNRLVDATHLPKLMDGRIDLRFSPALAHLPAAWPKGCNLLLTAQGRVYADSLPHPRFPPNAGNDNPPATVQAHDEQQKDGAATPPRFGS